MIYTVFPSINFKLLSCAEFVVVFMDICSIHVVIQGPKLTFLGGRQLATEFFFSRQLDNVVAKKCLQQQHQQQNFSFALKHK